MFVQQRPLTARFANLPDEHDGESAFTLEIVFSEAPSGTPSRGLKNRTLRNALSVTGGAVTRVRKVNHVPAHRIVTVQPAGREAVDIELPASPDCGAAGAICTAAGDGLETALLTRVRGPAALSVADAEVHEGPGAVLAFAVTLDRAASAAVRVDYATSDGTAQAGSDYTAATGSLTFAPGETARTVSVTVLDDSHDEGSETLTLRLSNPSGAYLADGVATGTIENTDAMPQAWIARFGRTVADQVLDAVDARLRASRTAGMSVSLAGQRIGLAAPKSGAESGAESGSDPNPASLFGGTAAEDAGETARLKALSDWLKQETAAPGGALRLRHRDVRGPVHDDAGDRARPVAGGARLQPGLAADPRRIRRRVAGAVAPGAPARERQRRHPARARDLVGGDRALVGARLHARPWAAAVRHQNKWDC